MTINNVVTRIKTIVTAHKQIRSYDAQLLKQDFNNEHTSKYPSAQLIVLEGDISLSNHATTFDFVLSFEDLVHVSQDTKQNDWDVLSDMVSIAEDIVTQLNSPEYNDWRIVVNSVRPISENDNDLTAGCEIRFSVSFMFSQNRCAIPSDLIISPTTDKDVKMYDLEYIATGNEGNTLTITALSGKKILLITREQSPIYKVSSNPDPAEYTWDDTIISLGTVTNPGERFLILYRNY